MAGRANGRENRRQAAEHEQPEEREHRPSRQVNVAEDEARGRHPGSAFTRCLDLAMRHVTANNGYDSADERTQKPGDDSKDQRRHGEAVRR